MPLLILLPDLGAALILRRQLKLSTTRVLTWKGLVDISLNLDSRLDDFHATW